MTFTPLPEVNDRVRVFLTQGDFARGQRALPVAQTWIGSFATGLRQTEDWSAR